MNPLLQLLGEFVSLDRSALGVLCGESSFKDITSAEERRDEKGIHQKSKSATQELEKKLKWEGKLSWDRLDDRERDEAFRFAEGYKSFLDRAKTEREAVQEIVRRPEKPGFRNRQKNPGGRNFSSSTRQNPRPWLFSVRPP